MLTGHAIPKSSVLSQASLTVGGFYRCVFYDMFLVDMFIIRCTCLSETLIFVVRTKLSTRTRGTRWTRTHTIVSHLFRYSVNRLCLHLSSSFRESSNQSHSERPAAHNTVRNCPPRRSGQKNGSCIKDITPPALANHLDPRPTKPPARRPSNTHTNASGMRTKYLHLPF